MVHDMLACKDGLVEYKDGLVAVTVVVLVEDNFRCLRLDQHRTTLGDFHIGHQHSMEQSTMCGTQWWHHFQVGTR